MKKGLRILLKVLAGILLVFLAALAAMQSPRVQSWAGSKVVEKLRDNMDADITFKIRHTADYNHATISDAGDGTYFIKSAKPIHGVAPGQFCVIYDEQHHRCYGSGEIVLK